MNQFFSLYTLTPWDNLSTQTLTHVKLLSLKSVFNTFPVIELSFFDDLQSNLKKSKHYSAFQAIKRIVGPDNEDYDIKNWYFLWAMDKDRRTFQFLFQKIKSNEEFQLILVALAPPELAKLFDEYKKDAILRTLSLINSPNKIKFLMMLTPKGKSIAEDLQSTQFSKQQIQYLNFLNTLKEIPNIRGEWFYAPRCPQCNQIMVRMRGEKKDSIRLVCPHCGYSSKK
jgi:hypothetical protein